MLWTSVSFQTHNSLIKGKTRFLGRRLCNGVVGAYDNNFPCSSLKGTFSHLLKQEYTERKREYTEEEDISKYYKDRWTQGIS
jgi:hypothetical protein